MPEAANQTAPWTLLPGQLSDDRLAVELDISEPALRVIRMLDPIIEWRGKPKPIRCDNGPKYISNALIERAEKNGMALMFIPPENPQQNAYVEPDNLFQS